MAKGLDVYFWIMVFILCSYMSGLMLHNIDLAWNINNAPNCIDTNAFGVRQNKVTMYVNAFSGLLVIEILQILSLIMIIKKKKYLNISFTNN